jgi:Holliday junction resolvasome RuvABC endonuclease subunit
MRVHGWDISLNHAGLVEFTDDLFTGFWFATTKKTVVKNLGEKGLYVAFPKCDEPHEAALLRLNSWRQVLGKLVKDRSPDYVGIEDYAYGASMRAHQIGELGGIARLICFNCGIKLRLHDPLSVKMFVAHNGHAKKPEIERCVKERWSQDFSEYNPPTRKGAKKENREVSEDLADAYGICRLLLTEVRLRSGHLLLKDLGHEKEIQVFNRVTKAYPVNLLSRDWIQKSDG